MNNSCLFKTSFLKLLTIVCSCFFLSGCLSGVWTGANLFYDRHTIYDSLSDYDLNTRALHALHQNEPFDCPECHIDLAVFNGDILLAGHVETEALREEAYSRVSKVSGYRRLFKRISIDPFRTDLMKDTWITAKIRSQIIADSEINPKSFKVVTSDQIVYLMGDVIPEQSAWVVDIARRTNGVIRVVKLFKYYNLSDKPVS